MENKKILIFYNAIGLGHKSIAENIGYYLTQAGYEVRLEDILHSQSNWLTRAFAWLYHIFITRLPFVWSFLYLSKKFTGMLITFRTKVAGKNYENVKMIIDAFEPDIVVSTHTVPSGVIAYLKQRGLYTGKFGIAFSDFHLHRYWLYDEADFYLVNIEDQKQQMVRLGIPQEKIFICGIILQPKIQVDVTAVKQKLEIKDNERVLLVGSGSQGTGIDKSLLLNLAKYPNVKVIVVCGKNAGAFTKLSSYFTGKNVLVLGFYKPMDELYAIADTFITKPGGLSIAEALRFNLPMLVSHVLPGQEELNMEYLQDKGLVMPEPISLEGGAIDELETHAFRKQLQANPEKNKLFLGNTVLIEAINSVIQ